MNSYWKIEILKISLKTAKGIKINKQIKQFKKLNLQLKKINLKKPKGIKISKHLKQLKELNLLLKSKKKKIIGNQINLLKCAIRKLGQLKKLLKIMVLN